METAVQNGDVETVRRMLKAGINVNAKITSGRTFLHLASIHGQTEVARLLIEYHADMEAKDKPNKHTPLLRAAEGGHSKTCELLIRAGADKTAKTNVNPWELLAQNRSAWRQLIHTGAEKAEKKRINTAAGKRATHQARYLGQRRRQEILYGGTKFSLNNFSPIERHRPNVPRGDPGATKAKKTKSTALHLAAGNGHPETCEHLILLGADVMARDTNQDTPLHRAALRRHAGTCERLIRFGADITAKNKDRKTPQIQGQGTRRPWKKLHQQAEKERSRHESLLTTRVPISRPRVCVVGDEKTGKSRLKKSIKKARYLIGVDIETFHVPEVGEVNWWDFTGRYAAADSRFMTAENTVFIVMYNIMDDSETKKTKLRKWLNLIKSRNPRRRPDVIFVASHADLYDLPEGQEDNPAQDEAVQLMRAEFGKDLRIRDEVILIDSRKAGTPEMDQLKSLLNELQHQRDSTELCRKIMERLPKWRKRTSPSLPVMMWPDFVRKVKKLDIFVTEDILKTSAQALDHLGEILFITPHISDPILVLTPKWLGKDIFGRIMTQSGTTVVTEEEIKHVFQGAADVDLLITLLQECQLCGSSDEKAPVPAQQSDELQDTEDPLDRNSPEPVNRESKVFQTVDPSEVDPHYKTDLPTPVQHNDELQDMEDNQETKVYAAVRSEATPLEAAQSMPTQRTDESLDGEDPLLKNRPALVQAMTNVESVLDHLLAKKILNVEECERIGTRDTSQDCARALLNIMHRKGKDARKVFESVLREVDPRAADVMMK
ncbi:hypothetical protein Bbelb_202180 [Branchiostoma belcheri]|nr:hypothetical protein Bbelb_202180 [Branchiostoma belcheri]